MYTLYLYTPDPILKQLYTTKSAIISEDSGIDLYLPETLSNLCGTVFLSHRVICKMTRTDQTGEHPIPYYIYPRSSLSKTRFRLANSVGIIDSGYRGELIAALDVLPQTSADGSVSFTPQGVEAHQRLVQVCTPTLEPCRLRVVDTLEELGNTERGANGFGSSGR